MHAWTCNEFAKPLVRGERKPDPLAPGSIRVKSKATSLNYRDWLVVQGKYDPRLPLPHVPGSDLAGVVLEAASDVRTLKVGDRVVAGFAPHWVDGKPTRSQLRNALGAGLPGVFQEEIVLPEGAWVRIPDTMSFEEAATLPCAGVTAFHALISIGNLQAEDTVLVQGTGGVSLFALRIARAKGARVLAFTSSPEKAATLESLGADEVWVHPRGQSFADEVRSRTSKKGVDHVVDVLGGAMTSEAIRCTATGGNVYGIGVLEDSAASSFPLMPLVMNAISLHGIMVGPVSSLRGLIDFHTQAGPGVLVPFEVAGIDSVNDSLQALSESRVVGKRVLVW